jgi:hypothetical protein
MFAMAVAGAPRAAIANAVAEDSITELIDKIR